MSRLKGLLAVMVLIAGCTQNPYSGLGGRVVLTEPVKPPIPMPPLVLDTPRSVEVREGDSLELQVKASVRAPGKPVVTVTGLPEGAIFDPQSLKLTWMPSFDAGNDNRDPDVIQRNYPVEFTLNSSEDAVTVVQRSLLISVRDVPQAISMNVKPDAIEMNEGEDFEQTIDVSSADYPQGPFDLQVKNLPMGAVIERDLTNPARFKIKYTPSFREVNVNEVYATWKIFVDRPLEVNLFAPRGVHIKAQAVWRIVDVREKAILLAPTKITQGTSVSFVVSAEDPNGEEPPTLSLAPRPGFGISDLRIEGVNPGNPSRGVNPSTVATFRWTQIPAEKIGTTETVNFRACVKKSRYSKDLCNDQPVKVTFELESHKAPVVDRTNFPLGTIRYVREQEKITVPIFVRDGEGATTAPSVTIGPDTAKDEVTWANGRLEIQGKKAGLKQFQMIATSVYAVNTVESFLVEVLPWSWSSLVLFGEGPGDPEVKATSPFFESAQVANPVLQLGDPRLLVLRKSVYLGTSAFNEPTVVAPMEKLATQVENIIVATPLLEKLEGDLKTELSDGSIKVGPRVADLTGYSLEVDPASGLTPPTDPIKLGAKLTAESAHPAAVEYSGSTGKCKVLLVLKKAGETDIPVAQICSRTTRGKLLIAGIEFADIRTSPTDNRIVKKWITDLVAP